MSLNTVNRMNVVKNRAPAPIQISAEQIVREAADRQLDATGSGASSQQPIVKIHDAEEYQQHLADRRTLYETNIRYRREHIGNWVKYAKFEEENHEYERSRSIYERALEVEFRNATLWLRYVEFELRIECINHARNILDRAIQILPRIDFLWYKYVWMEELCQDYTKCRTVFERWVQWLPDDNVWIAYARFEIRQVSTSTSGGGGGGGNDNHNDNQHYYDAAMTILQRYVTAYPTANAYIKFAKFVEYEIPPQYHNQQQQSVLSSPRSIYETALTTLEPEEIQQSARFFIQFANMEERQQEYDRARVIYQYAIQLLQLNTNTNIDGDNNNNNNTAINDDTNIDNTDISPQEQLKRRQLVQQYSIFEKKHGTKQQIESVIVQQHQTEYERHIVEHPYDYDTYIEYALMLQDYYDSQQQSTTSKTTATAVQTNQIRDIYERAIGQIPPDATTTTTTVAKDAWRRYIYLFIYYAIYEELTCRNRARAIQVYTTCINMILLPRTAQFMFGKIWILLGQLYIRDHNITAARKLFGRALGTMIQSCTTTSTNNNSSNRSHIEKTKKKMEKIYVTYIQIEFALGEIDRCRTLYHQFVQQLSHRSTAWIQFANFEATIGESDRCRAIYELAISSSSSVQHELDTPEVVWKCYIDFEIEEGDSDKVRALYKRLLQLTQHVKVYISYGQFECTSIGNGINAAREIFQTAYQYYKNSSSNNGKEERVLLLDAWRVLEKVHGTMEDVTMVEQKMPRRIKRKRMRYDDNDIELGYEEYFDYQFPDDDADVNNTDTTTAATAAATFKMLEMAAQWKQQQQENKRQRRLQDDDAGGTDTDDDNDDDSDDE